jgi:hypothetical protein
MGKVLQMDEQRISKNKSIRMLRDDEQVIRTEPTPPPPPPTPGLVEKLEAMGFRPFTEEW